jgi:hypothetical protein
VDPVTIVIVVCAVVLVTLSALLAVGLSRAAARGDEGINTQLTALRTPARTRTFVHSPPEDATKELIALRGPGQAPGPTRSPPDSS